MSEYQKHCNHDKRVVNFYLKSLNKIDSKDVVALNNIIAIPNNPELAKLMPTKQVFSSDPHLKVNRENALVNAGITSDDTVIANLNQKIDSLARAIPELSKNKGKKARKAINRLKSTVKSIKNSSVRYFTFPVYKHPQMPSKSAIKSFFEDYQESLGACLLPSEVLAKEQQNEYKKNH